MRTLALHPASPRPLARALLPAFAIGALLLVAACDDDPVTPPSHPSRPAVLSGAELFDTGIDPSDTWVLTEATTQTQTTIDYGTPTVDPATGATVTSLTLPTITETVRTEAGYAPDGTIRINTYFAGGDTLVDVARVQMVGDSVTYFDRAGQPRLDLAGSDLVATLGSFSDDVVTDSIILAESGAVAPTGPGVRTAAMVRDAGGSPVATVPGTVSPSGDVLELESDLSDAASGATGRRTRIFTRRPGGFAIAEERVQLRTERAGIATTVSQHTRYDRVAWSNAPARDRARRARSAHRAKLGDGLPGVVSRVSERGAPAFLRAVDARGEPAPSAWLPVPPAPDTGTTSLLPLSIGYVHGGLSDASTWTAMDAWMTSNFSIRAEVKPSLAWRTELESQARSLYGTLSSSGGSGFLLVGHSNGGLVARRAAQMAAASPNLVKGVVTISSPHLGLPIARVGRQVVSDYLTGQLQRVTARIGGSCWRGQFGFLCDYAALAATEMVPRLVTYALDNTIPVARDVQPGSAFLTTLNATPESFKRYSLETSSQGQWKFLRLLGDWRCEPDDRCGGNRLQNTMESVYTVLRTCGSNEIFKARLGSFADKCRDVRWTLSGLNAQYERWTAPDDDSDGIVPMKSQRYPGVPDDARYVGRNTRDSHASELRSGRERTAMRSVGLTFGTN